MSPVLYASRRSCSQGGLPQEEHALMLRNYQFVGSANRWVNTRKGYDWAASSSRLEWSQGLECCFIKGWHYTFWFLCFSIIVLPMAHHMLPKSVVPFFQLLPLLLLFFLHLSLELLILLSNLVKWFKAWVFSHVQRHYYIHLSGVKWASFLIG